MDVKGDMNRPNKFTGLSVGPEPGFSPGGRPLLATLENLTQNPRSPDRTLGILIFGSHDYLRSLA